MNSLESEFTVGSYRVAKRIGSNGYALYVAIHVILDHLAFLRRIPCHHCPPDAIARFMEELRFLDRIDHPNILKIYDCFRLDTYLFLFTEYVDAPTLSDIFRQGRRLNQTEVINMTVPVLDALSSLHNMGCAHGAMQPQNIFLSGKGRAVLEFPPMSRLMLLLDPDSARLLVSKAPLLYISPEIIKLGHGDIRSELYSRTCHV